MGRTTDTDLRPLQVRVPAADREAERAGCRRGAKSAA